ncbi:hypothetical protein PG984_005501 [Apiospora sp. TS-2023a]
MAQLTLSQNRLQLVHLGWFHVGQRVGIARERHTVVQVASFQQVIVHKGAGKQRVPRLVKDRRAVQVRGRVLEDPEASQFDACQTGELLLVQYEGQAGEEVPGQPIAPDPVYFGLARPSDLHGNRRIQGPHLSSSLSAVLVVVEAGVLSQIDDYDFNCVLHANGKCMVVGNGPVLWHRHRHRMAVGAVDGRRRHGAFVLEIVERNAAQFDGIQRFDDDFDQPTVHPTHKAEIRHGGEELGGVLANVGAVHHEAEKGALARDQVARAVLVRKVGHDNSSPQSMTQIRKPFRKTALRDLGPWDPAVVMAAEVDILEQEGEGKDTPGPGDEPEASEGLDVAVKLVKNEKQDVCWRATIHTRVNHGRDVWLLFQSYGDKVMPWD